MLNKAQLQAAVESRAASKEAGAAKEDRILNLLLKEKAMFTGGAAKRHPRDRGREQVITGSDARLRTLGCIL